jgi:hypothetical protein
MSRSNKTDIYKLPYPVSDDNVNVHDDIRDLAVQLELLLPDLGYKRFTISVTNATGQLIPAGTICYISGHNGQKPLIDKAIPSDESTLPIAGITKNDIANNASGALVIIGLIENINTVAFAVQDILYLSNTSGLTNSRPETGPAIAVGYCIRAHATEGMIMYGKQKSANPTWKDLLQGMA